jgi:hypothetical protein
MYKAIKNDDLAAVSRLLNASERYLTEVPADAPKIMSQIPPLNGVAAYFGSLRCLEFFIDQGMDVFACDKKGVCLWIIGFLLILRLLVVKMRFSRFWRITARILSRMTQIILVLCNMEPCLDRSGLWLFSLRMAVM